MGQRRWEQKAEDRPTGVPMFGRQESAELPGNQAGAGS